MKKKRKIQLFGGLAVLLLAALIAGWLVTSKEPASKGRSESRATLVDVMTVESETARPELSFKGNLRPARRLSLPTQVGGEIMALNEDLELGGLIEAGEVLLQLETADYEAALKQAKAQLAEAVAQLELERGRHSVAKEELEFYRDRELVEEADLKESLVLREPQLNRAQAAAMRAEAAVSTARLNLQRTTLRAPFDCIVEQESVEVGQAVGGGQVVAVLLGTERGLVEARVAAGQLPLMQIPGWNGSEGSKGTARYRTGEGEVTREARVLRLAGSLDPVGRMARLVLEVSDPLGVEYLRNEYEEEVEESGTMLFGAFVEVTVPVAKARELIALPGWAVQEGGRVLVMSGEGKLEIREPQVFLRDSETVFLSEGLESGDRVVTSLIANPIEGMALRVEVRSDEAAEEGVTKDG